MHPGKCWLNCHGRRRGDLKNVPCDTTTIPPAILHRGGFCRVSIFQQSSHAACIFQVLPDVLPTKAGPVVMASAFRAVRSAHPFILALWLLAGAACAQPARLEVQVKAAYLYKFAGFVDWPGAAFARPDSALVIGVVGNDELAAQLEKVVSGRSVGGHPLAVRRVQRGESLAGLHVLYAASADAAAATTVLLAAARGLPLLTVGDAPDAPSAMIRFHTVEQRLRFEVALAQVAPSGLKISARMLAAAWRVTGGA